jgi:hypothetical protein
VSKDGELEGLDIHEHGTPPYHVELGPGMTYSTPNLPRREEVTVLEGSAEERTERANSVWTASRSPVTRS